MVANGSTASHIGTKWGVALLDPAASVVAANIGGEVADLPAPYAEPSVLKVLVVMTDGDNRDHYDLYDDYRSGASDVFTVLENQAQCYDNPNNWRVPYFISDGSGFVCQFVGSARRTVVIIDDRYHCTGFLFPLSGAECVQNYGLNGI